MLTVKEKLMIELAMQKITAAQHLLNEAEQLLTIIRNEKEENK